MAADGPGILESDLAHDVYNEILDLYDAGVEVPDIRARLSSDYENDDMDDMEMEIYLAAAARALWEIGHLDEALGVRLAQPHVIRPAHHMLRRAGNSFAVIGHVELDPSKFVLGSFGGVMDIADVAEEFVITETNAAAFGRELLPLRDLVRT